MKTSQQLKTDMKVKEFLLIMFESSGNTLKDTRFRS